MDELSPCRPWLIMYSHLNSLMAAAWGPLTPLSPPVPHTRLAATPDIVEGAAAFFTGLLPLPGAEIPPPQDAAPPTMGLGPVFKLLMVPVDWRCRAADVKYLREQRNKYSKMPILYTTWFQI